MNSSVSVIYKYPYRIISIDFSYLYTIIIVFLRIIPNRNVLEHVYNISLEIIDFFENLTCKQILMKIIKYLYLLSY